MFNDTSIKSKCFPFLVLREAALKRVGVLGGGEVVCDHEQFEQKARDESPARKKGENENEGGGRAGIFYE